MNPSDWVADCMLPDAWLHEPFTISGEVVASDGSCLIAFPSCKQTYPAPRFDQGQDCSEQIRAFLSQASMATCTPVTDIKGLGLNEQHTARLAEAPGLHVLREETRIIFQAMDTDTGEVVAYGIIQKGAQAT